MGNRRQRHMTTSVDGADHSFAVISMGLDFIRIQDPQAYRLPAEFVFKLTGTLGFSVGWIDWIDGDRVQIRIERHGPLMS